MTTPLSHTKKYLGLHRYCGQCRKDITDSCRQGTTEKPVHKCKYPERHQYKIILYNDEGKRKTKNLATRDFDEAVKALHVFKAEIKGDNKELPVQQRPEPLQSVSPAPFVSANDNLLENMAVYVATLAGDEAVVPAFRKRSRSTKHVKEVSRTFKYLALSLQHAGHDVERLGIRDITEKMMESLHHYLLDERKLSNRSYNKAIGIISSFYTFLKEEGHVTTNPCAKIPHRAVGKNSKGITPEEFEKLLEVIERPELGTARVGKENKSFHRPWLADAFRLAYHTGRRNYELSRMAFDCIYEDEQQNPAYIKIPDTKVNRQKGIEDTDLNAKHIFVPITDPLREVINELGYLQHRGTSRYLIAGDEETSRDTIKDVMSRAFSVYYKHVGKRDLTLKSCRKSYITELSIEIGMENTRHITKHSNLDVIGENYIDNEQMVKSVARNFRSRKQSESPELER